MLLKEEGSTYLVRKGADGECRVSYKQLHQLKIKILRIRRNKINPSLKWAQVKEELKVHCLRRLDPKSIEKKLVGVM